MRLINVDILTNGKGVFSNVIHVDFEKGGGYIMVEDLLNILDNQPTAYDVDKVVERLMCESINCHIMTYRAVEIVKSGGIE